MEKVDAKQEMDAMFAHLSDTIHFVGFITIPSVGPVAYVRIIIPEDGPLRPWPKKLVYKHAVEVSTGLRMFSICEPGEFMNSLLMTEWDEAYQNFVDLADKSHTFIVEVVTPRRKLKALVIHEEVKETTEHPITPKDYEELQNAYRHSEKVRD